MSLLGYVPARGDEPIFLEAIEKVISAAKRHGKWGGRMVNNGAMAKENASKYNLFAISGDTKALGNWYLDQIDTFNK